MSMENVSYPATPSDGRRTLPEKLGPPFWLSLMWLAVITGCALSADLLPLAPFESMDWKAPAAPPGSPCSTITAVPPESRGLSCIHILGTDQLGRDMLSRVIHGARISLAVGLASPLIGLVAGGILGMLAGFFRGPFETTLMALMDTILAFPGLVLLLAITAALGPNLFNMTLALGVLTVPSFARVARASTLAAACRDHVLAARMTGMTDGAILCREILPNILTPLGVYALLVVSYMIMAEGALSFLGMSVPAPFPSWGGMIAGGREVLEEAPHVSLIPAIVMFLTVLSFNLIGDRVRAVADAREGQL